MQLEFTEGYTFERGYSSPYFLLGEEADFIEWKNPHVLVCDYKIESAQAMLPILEHFVRTKEPLVIIAEDFSTDMLQTCIINSMRRLLKVVGKLMNILSVQSTRSPPLQQHLHYILHL